MGTGSDLTQLEPAASRLDSWVEMHVGASFTKLKSWCLDGWLDLAMSLTLHELVYFPKQHVVPSIIVK
ncbi:hypothetical protein Lal_00034478 [Lupinus albus]|nr:hypothetical protein Lal_00034478 [Lupinus albus]